jgi:hypothetical protein
MSREIGKLRDRASIGNYWGGPASARLVHLAKSKLFYAILPKYEPLYARKLSSVSVSSGPTQARLPAAAEQTGTTPMAACIVNLIKNLVRYQLFRKLIV